MDTIDKRSNEIKESLILEGMDEQTAEYCVKAFRCGCVSQMTIDIDKARKAFNKCAASNFHYSEFYRILIDLIYDN